MLNPAKKKKRYFVAETRGDVDQMAYAWHSLLRFPQILDSTAHLAPGEGKGWWSGSGASSWARNQVRHRAPCSSAGYYCPLRTCQPGASCFCCLCIPCAPVPGDPAAGCFPSMPPTPCHREGPERGLTAGQPLPLPYTFLPCVHFTALVSFHPPQKP